MHVHLQRKHSIKMEVYRIYEYDLLMANLAWRTRGVGFGEMKTLVVWLRYQSRIWIASKSRAVFRGNDVWSYRRTNEYILLQRQTIRVRGGGNYLAFRYEKTRGADVEYYSIVDFYGMGTRIGANRITVLRKKS